jgi:protein involved in polysaccharide export with SLBB domain
MNKKISINNTFSYILFSALFAFSTFAFSVGILDGLGLTPSQQLQAQSLASQLGVTTGKINMGPIESPKFQEAVDKEEEFEEYQFSKIEKLLNGESIEQNFINTQILKQFGYDIFNKVPLTFAPVTDAPVPSNYVIGPGDTVNILFFGTKSIDFSQQVTRDGNLEIPDLGPVSVAGLTFSELKVNINERISNQMIGVKVSVSLGELRSIRIFVLGDVEKPGSYTVNSLATLTNAIFSSGGVTRIGTLRDIQLKRNGKIISHFDLYDLLLRGDTSSDRRLLPGDVVFVPPIGPTVGILGEVRRPAIYELRKDRKDLLSAIIAAGGASPGSKTTEIMVKSVSNVEGVSAAQIDLTTTLGKSHQLRDGDVVQVAPVLEYNQDGFIILAGEVVNPGVYLITPNEALSSVIQRAGGFTNKAYLQGSVFTRKSLRRLEEKRKNEALQELEKEQLLETQPSGVVTTNYESLRLFISKLKSIPSLGRMVISLEAIVAGESTDIVLKHGDTLSIPTISQEVTVIGEVYHSTSHLYNADYDVDDYISNSGGMKKGSDASNIYVIKANGSVIAQRNTGQTFFRNTGGNMRIAAGDTIVVPIDTERETSSESWVKYTTIASQFAITLASFKTLGLF